MKTRFPCIRFAVTSLAVLTVVLFSTVPLDAGGKGRGRGAGRGHRGRSHRPAFRGRSHQPAFRRHNVGRPRDFHPGRGRGHRFHHREFTDRHRDFNDHRRDFTDHHRPFDGRQHSLDVQRRNEERILKHRQQVADQLRDIAVENGNTQLLDTADRMEQNALDHYNRRIEKINNQLEPVADPISTPPADGSPADAASDAPGAAADSGTSADHTHPETSALQEDLLNDTRALDRRMDTARRLRTLAHRNGNPRLSRAAERIEQSAIRNFEHRMQRVDALQAGFPTNSDIVADYPPDGEF